MSTSAQVTMIRTAVTAAGGTFPKAVAEALTDRDKIAEASAAFNAPTTDQISDAIVACLLRGDDPADDEQVRHLTTARALGSTTIGGYAMSVVGSAERRVVTALTNSADDIVTILAGATTEAADKLANAFGLIGDHDLADSQTILSLGPDAARAWAEAREAQQLLRTLIRGWGTLANLTGFASTSSASTLRLADLDLDTFEKVGRNAEAWDIVRAGGTISLADRYTIKERADRIERERQQRHDSHSAAAQHAAGGLYRFTA